MKKGFAMKNRWKMLLAAAAGAVLLAVAGYFVYNHMYLFPGYDDDEALAAAEPRASYRTEEYRGNWDNNLLTASRLRVRGVIEILSTRQETESVIPLVCSYKSLIGEFKLILVGENGEVSTLFDSEKLSSGSTVNVKLPAGESSLRLAGRPAKLRDLELSWKGQAPEADTPKTDLSEGNISGKAKNNGDNAPVPVRHEEKMDESIKTLRIEAENCNVKITASDDDSCTWSFDESSYYVKTENENGTMLLRVGPLPQKSEDGNWEEMVTELTFPKDMQEKMTVVGNQAGVSVKGFNMNLELVSDRGAMSAVLPEGFDHSLDFSADESSGSLLIAPGADNYIIKADGEDLKTSAFSVSEDFPEYKLGSSYEYQQGNGHAELRLHVRNSAFSVGMGLGTGAVSLVDLGTARSGAESGKVKLYADLRGIDEKKTIKSGEYYSEDIGSYWFNQNTVFEGNEELAARILEKGKDPGLKISQLHAQGITGENVTVAIIDQPLLTEHPEYAGRLEKYHTVGLKKKDSPSSMHGPAVTSLLAGNTIGTAPGVKLYYVAMPFWEKEKASEWGAQALDWLIEQNKELPEDGKIRAVSISADFTNAENFDNPEAWEEAVKRAQEAGILVLDCRKDYDTCVFWPSYFDPDNRDDISLSRIGNPPGKFQECPPQALGTPVGYRTVAEVYREGEYSYAYDAEGGHSWAIPYGTGVLALGWQLNPTLTGQEMLALLRQTAYRDAEGGSFMDPMAFIEAVRATLQ